ncbi:MAG: DDE-type integrase/transposase/recombinase, partial [Candidatus Paceibacterota bacterium]
PLDKELLSIVEALTVWRAWLLSAQQPFCVFTDHKNLEDFTRVRKLSRKLARWLDLFAQFDFRVIYTPREELVPEDALSKREELQFSREEMEELLNKPMFPKSYSNPVTGAFVVGTLSVSFIHRVREAQREVSPEEREKISSLSYHEVDDLWKKRGRTRIPSKALQWEVLQQRHDGLSAGHLGARRTVERVREDFTWPNLRDMVKGYVKSCVTCQRAKKRRHPPHGLLKPIVSSSVPWTTISMDFVTGLPVCKGYNAILTVVDRFSKMVRFLPVRKKMTAGEVARVFVDSIFSLHGLPDSVISDRDKTFMSAFWQELMRILGVAVDSSTARHPQTDGQSERANQSLEQLIRVTCNHSGSDWLEKLPLMEFAHNAAVNESTGMSPFFICYGRHPRGDLLNVGTASSPNPNARDFVESLKEIHKLATDNLKIARDRMKRSADRKRVKGPELEVGDLVLLNRSEIKSRKEFPKMDLPFMGPFRITKVISDVAFKLALPAGTRLHNVFHVSQLEKFVERSEGPKQLLPANLLPEDITADPSMELIPTLVLDSRVHYGKKQYLVRAANCSHENDTWIDQSLVPPVLIERFLHKHQSIPWDKSSPEYWETVYSAWRQKPINLSSTEDLVDGRPPLNRSSVLDQKNGETVETPTRPGQVASSSSPEINQTAPSAECKDGYPYPLDPRVAPTSKKVTFVEQSLLKEKPEAARRSARLREKKISQESTKEGRSES